MVCFMYIFENTQHEADNNDDDNNNNNNNNNKSSNSNPQQNKICQLNQIILYFF
jgi:hypothetical protein